MMNDDSKLMMMMMTYDMRMRHNMYVRCEHDIINKCLQVSISISACKLVNLN